MQGLHAKCTGTLVEVFGANNGHERKQSPMSTAAPEAEKRMDAMLTNFMIFFWRNFA